MLIKADGHILLDIIRFFIKPIKVSGDYRGAYAGY